MTALIEYLTVLLEYIDLLGPPAEWGPGQNAPVAPLSAALSPTMDITSTHPVLQNSRLVFQRVIDS